MYWSHKYMEVLRALDIDPTGDREATMYLDRIIRKEDYGEVQGLINGRPVIVFGCGPSLETDLQKLIDAGLQRKFIAVAVDGSIYMLLRYRLQPHIHVTDLDGDIDSILLANRHGTLTFIHAHAENRRAVEAVCPRLRGKVFGVTRSKETEKVRNFGGFTDGDIAVHLADHFKPGFIVLSGMDYGHIIGVHSGRYDPIKKPRSMRVSKDVLEALAGRTKTRVYNMTSGGEYIRHTTHADILKLREILGE